MTFLANENFPSRSIEYLRTAGYNVVSTLERFQGASDEEVITIAQENKLVILTMDKDYGTLVFKEGIVNPPAIIFFRVPTERPSDLPGRTLVKYLAEGSLTISGRFTVLEPDKALRQRAYKD